MKTEFSRAEPKVYCNGGCNFCWNVEEERFHLAPREALGDNQADNLAARIGCDTRPPVNWISLIRAGRSQGGGFAGRRKRISVLHRGCFDDFLRPRSYVRFVL